MTQMCFNSENHKSKMWRKYGCPDEIRTLPLDIIWHRKLKNCGKIFYKDLVMYLDNNCFLHPFCFQCRTEWDRLRKDGRRRERWNTTNMVAQKKVGRQMSGRCGNCFTNILPNYYAPFLLQIWKSILLCKSKSVFQ